MSTASSLHTCCGGPVAGIVTAPHRAEVDMKWTLLRAWFAGFVATMIITLMVYFVSPDLTGGPSDLAALLAGLMGVSWVAGLGAHFLIGTVVLPSVYLLLQNRLITGGATMRGMTWKFLLWVLSQAVVVPASGGGFFSQSAGGLRAAFDSLLAHLLYGLVLGLFAGDARESSYYTRPAYPPGAQARRAV
jgi:hypothetical protein